MLKLINERKTNLWNDIIHCRLNFIFWPFFHLITSISFFLYFASLVFMDTHIKDQNSHKQFLVFRPWESETYRHLIKIIIFFLHIFCVYALNRTEYICSLQYFDKFLSYALFMVMNLIFLSTLHNNKSMQTKCFVLFTVYHSHFIVN